MNKFELYFPGAGLQSAPWEFKAVCVQEIAEYMSRSVGYAFALVNSPDFPRPITIGKRNRRWLAGDVVNYLKLQSEEASRGQIINEPINIHYLPHTTEFRERRSS